MVRIDVFICQQSTHVKNHLCPPVFASDAKQSSPEYDCVREPVQSAGGAPIGLPFCITRIHRKPWPAAKVFCGTADSANQFCGALVRHGAAGTVGLLPLCTQPRVQN